MMFCDISFLYYSWIFLFHFLKLCVSEMENIGIDWCNISTVFNFVFWSSFKSAAKNLVQIWTDKQTKQSRGHREGKWSNFIIRDWEKSALTTAGILFVQNFRKSVSTGYTARHIFFNLEFCLSNWKEMKPFFVTFPNESQSRI